jgi:NADH-quinone oxidoreductase subunit J
MELNFESIVFWALAVFITISSLLTVTTKHMVRAATWLLFTLFGTAGIYFLLGYTFLGSVQIMVYAGGIVVLYVFSILLTSGEGDRVEKLLRSKWFAGLGATLAGAVIVIFITLKHQFVETSSLLPIEMDFKELGHQMLSSDKYGYLLPFEAVSILLLACIVGGLIIARKR